MGRSPCGGDESGLKKGPWTPEEDQKLVKFIQENGHGSWRSLPKLAGLNRCGKSCRLRWTNYLRPDIKRGKFSQEEEQTILNLHSILGNKWSAMANQLPGRTDNEIKNFWNAHLKKKLNQMGIDPITHRPRAEILSSLPYLIALANLKDLIDQHHHPREELQADAVQMAKLQCLQYLLQSSSTSISSGSNNMHTSNLSNSVLSSSSQLDIGIAAAGSVQGFDDSTPFPGLPDLQIPCEYLTSTNKYTMAEAEVQENSTVLSQGDLTTSSPSSPWLSTSSATPSPPVIPSVTESLINNLGDASCSSSYGGRAAPSGWPDDDQLLFEDPLFHELFKS